MDQMRPGVQAIETCLNKESATNIGEPADAADGPTTNKDKESGKETDKSRMMMFHRIKAVLPSTVRRMATCSGK